ncbi:MAG: amidohydrolase/deacetylase family metallohydrolase [Gaiellales bacterium]
MRFDLLIKGGHVIDPGEGRDGELDVAVAGGRIAAVDREIPAETAASVVDATGQLVTPGLVDLHTHVFDKVTYWGIAPDPVASTTGVTTWNDAGSAGALTIAGLREFVVDRAAARITAFLNISCIGLVADNYECANLALLDPDLFVRLADRHRDLVRGVKVRLGTPTVGDNDVEPLRRALRAAQECELPLMVHIAIGPPAIEDVLELLRPGDILTHCCTGLTMKLVDDRGALLDVARKAWDSGVVMDVGHGTGSFSFETTEALLAAGRRPDVISSDLHQLSVNGPAFDLPTCMSKFLALGVPLRDVVAAATSRPAEILGIADCAGSLRVGAPADLAILRLHRGRFPLYDIAGAVREGGELLASTHTIIGGDVLDRLPPAPPAPWAEEPIWPDAQHPFTAQQRRLREDGHTPAAMAAAASDEA